MQEVVVEYKEIAPLEVKIEKTKAVGTFDIELVSQEKIRIVMNAYKGVENHIDAITSYSITSGLVCLGNPIDYFDKAFKMLGITPKFDIDKYISEFLAKSKILFADIEAKKRIEMIAQYSHHPFLTTVKDDLLNAGYIVNIPAPEELAKGMYLCIKACKGEFRVTIEYAGSKIKISPSGTQDNKFVYLYKSILPKIEEMNSIFLSAQEYQKTRMEAIQKIENNLRDRVKNFECEITSDQHYLRGNAIIQFTVRHKTSTLMSLTPRSDQSFNVNLDQVLTIGQIMSIINILKKE